MYEYEISRYRSADLSRQAEQERLAREVVRVRRAARHEATRHAAEDESHSRGVRRLRSARAA